MGGSHSLSPMLAHQVRLWSKYTLQSVHSIPFHSTFQFCVSVVFTGCIATQFRVLVVLNKYARHISQSHLPNLSYMLPLPFPSCYVPPTSCLHLFLCNLISVLLNPFPCFAFFFCGILNNLRAKIRSDGRAEH